MADILARMRQLIGDPTEWAANDIVLGRGELALEVSGNDTMLKVGDGAQTYSQLPYVALGQDSLPLTGGTLTGPLILPAADPTQPAQATTKKYVDDAITAAAGTGAVLLDPPAGTSQRILPGAAADVPLTLQGRSGQTGNLMEAGHLSILPDGSIELKTTPTGDPAQHVLLEDRDPGGEGASLSLLFAGTSREFAVRGSGYDASGTEVRRMQLLGNSLTFKMDDPSMNTPPWIFFGGTTDGPDGAAVIQTGPSSGSPGPRVALRMPLELGVGVNFEFSTNWKDVSALISVADGTEPAGGWSPKEVVTFEKLAASDAVLQTPAPGVSQSITAADAADTPLTLIPATGQTAPLFKAQHAEITKDGYFHHVTSPSDPSGIGFKLERLDGGAFAVGGAVMGAVDNNYGGQFALYHHTRGVENAELLALSARYIKFNDKDAANITRATTLTGLPTKFGVQAGRSGAVYHKGWLEALYDQATMLPDAIEFSLDQENLTARFSVGDDTEPAAGWDPKEIVTVEKGDTRYVNLEDLIDTSQGALDAGKPIKLNSAGRIDLSMLDMSVLTFKGVIDATTVHAPPHADRNVGDVWVNSIAGTPHATWGLPTDIMNGDLIVWDGTQFDAFANTQDLSIFLDIPTADARYVNVDGDTMTGDLELVSADLTVGGAATVKGSATVQGPASLLSPNLVLGAATSTTDFNIRATVGENPGMGLNFLVTGSQTGAHGALSIDPDAGFTLAFGASAQARTPFLQGFNGGQLLAPGADATPVTGQRDGHLLLNMDANDARYPLRSEAIVATPAAGTSQSITSSAPADIPLTMKGSNNQTAPLFKAEQLTIEPHGGILWEHNPYDAKIGFPVHVINRDVNGAGGDVILAPDRLYSGVAVRSFDPTTGDMMKQGSFNSAGLQFVDTRSGHVPFMAFGHSNGQAYLNINTYGVAIPPNKRLSVLEFEVDTATGEVDEIRYSLDHTSYAAKLTVTDATEPSSGWDPKEIVTIEKGDTRYAALDDFADVSAGAGDAGKPVKLNAAGIIDSTMLDVQSMTFKGVINAVTQSAPGAPSNGDVWVSDATGTAHGSWGLTQPVNSGDMLIWDGTHWSQVSSAQDLSQFITHADADARYVRLTGSTMTGRLTLSGDPTAALHAAPKRYVDTSVAPKIDEAVADTRYVPKDDLIDTSRGALDAGKPIKLDSGGRVDQTMLTLAALTFRAVIDVTTQGPPALTARELGDVYVAKASGTPRPGWGIPNDVNAGDLIIWDGTDYDDVSSTQDLSIFLTVQDARREFLSLTGGTLTGDLTLPARNPTQGNQAARKTYVDQAVAPKIDETVADSRYFPKAGGTVGGMVTLPATNPSAANHATRKAYVDAQVGTRLTQAEATSLYVNKSGDTMSGPLTLPLPNPTANVHAAHKGYVDGQVATRLTQAQGDARYVRDGTDTLRMEGTGPAIHYEQSDQPNGMKYWLAGVQDDTYIVGPLDAAQQWLSTSFHIRRNTNGVSDVLFNVVGDSDHVPSLESIITARRGDARYVRQVANGHPTARVFCAGYAHPNGGKTIMTGWYDVSSPHPQRMDITFGTAAGQQPPSDQYIVNVFQHAGSWNEVALRFLVFDREQSGFKLRFDGAHMTQPVSFACYYLA